MRILHRTTRGFTLVEVVVALAVVAVGASALLAALNSSAETTVYLRDKTFAKWIALNLVAETRLAMRKPAPGESTGEVEFAGGRWHWRRVVEEVENVSGMLRIDVSVRPAHVGGGPNSNWYATVSGVTSDAVAPPRGDLPAWSQDVTPGGEPSGGGDDEDDKTDDATPPPDNEPPENGTQ